MNDLNELLFGEGMDCSYDQNEIGAFIAPNKPKDLWVFGLSRHKNNPKTIGIELGGQAFAPIVDVQGNIRHLINTNRKIAASYDFSAFGKPLQTSPRNGLRNSWQFASKRLDPELGLIYFGKRYYDPELGRWITTDPAGFTDSTNPYQYVLNNPFMYHDPNGESVLGFCVGLAQIAAGGALIISGAAIEIATLGGYTIGFGFQAQAGVALIASGLAMTTYHAQDIGLSNISWKDTDVYVPDHLLPNTPDRVHVPDIDVPHTQLGIKEGRKGKYPQAREFDKNSNPVRDIDFTDHGRSQNHPNPHQHEHKPNPTGGTRIRDPKDQPVIGWNYI